MTSDHKAPLPEEVETLKDIRDLLFIIACKIAYGTANMEEYKKKKYIKNAKKRIQNEQR